MNTRWNVGEARKDSRSLWAMGDDHGLEHGTEQRCQFRVVAVEFRFAIETGPACHRPSIRVDAHRLGKCGDAVRETPLIPHHDHRTEGWGLVEGVALANEFRSRCFDHFSDAPFGTHHVGRIPSGQIGRRRFATFFSERRGRFDPIPLAASTSSQNRSRSATRTTACSCASANATGYPWPSVIWLQITLWTRSRRGRDHSGSSNRPTSEPELM